MLRWWDGANWGLQTQPLPDTPPAMAFPVPGAVPQPSPPAEVLPPHVKPKPGPWTWTVACNPLLGLLLAMAGALVSNPNGGVSRPVLAGWIAGAVFAFITAIMDTRSLRKAPTAHVTAHDDGRPGAS